MHNSHPSTRILAPTDPCKMGDCYQLSHLIRETWTPTQSGLSLVYQKRSIFLKQQGCTSIINFHERIVVPNENTQKKQKTEKNKKRSVSVLAILLHCSDFAKPAVFARMCFIRKLDIVAIERHEQATQKKKKERPDVLTFLFQATRK